MWGTQPTATDRVKSQIDDGAYALVEWSPFPAPRSLWVIDEIQL